MKENDADSSEVGRRDFVVRERQRRGFASTLFAVLAIVLISGIAAVLLSSSFQQRATLASFESRKTANSFENAVVFLNSSLADALVDFDYAKTGCAPDPTRSNFAAFSQNYLASAAAELNSQAGGGGSGGSGIEPVTSVSVLSVERTEFTTGVPPGFDYYAVADAAVLLSVRAGSAFKNETVSLERRIDVNNTGISSDNVWRVNESGLELNVRCA